MKRFVFSVIANEMKQSMRAGAGLLCKLAIMLIILLPFATGALGAELVREKDRPQVLGAQIFVIPDSYADNLNNYFADLRSRGVNTVFFRAFHNVGDKPHLGVQNICTNGGVYFESETACMVAPLLPEVVEAAHNNGLRIFAWMATRSLSFLKTDNLISKSFSPDSEQIINGYGANIFLPQVKNALFTLFEEIAATGVDGILIQDDFIMKYSEGADYAACGHFTSATKLTCSAETFFKDITTTSAGRRIYSGTTEAYDRWTAWKADELAKLFGEIRHRVRLIDPAIAWAVNIYYETPVFPDRGLAWYGHDLDKLWAAGADYLAVMAYREQISDEMGYNNSQMKDFYQKLATGMNEKNPNADSARAIYKVQSRLFDSSRSAADPIMLESDCAVLMNNDGVSFVQLPINSPFDIVKNVCGY